MEKTYELRKLKAGDIFTMSSIISKIGIDQMKSVISPDFIKRSLDPEANQDELELELGMTMAAELIQVILKNLSKCKKDIYHLLADMSGMSDKEIEALDLDVFMDMLVDVIQSDGFMGFIKAASRLFK